MLYERQAERELDEPRSQFDEAFASYSFESCEQLKLLDLDGARYSVIALDPAAEESAAGRVQIYAYSVIEHFQELMHDVVLGHERYVTVVRECTHWMALLAADTTMEPEIKDVLMHVLTRVRHAANEAPQSRAAQRHLAKASAQEVG